MCYGTHLQSKKKKENGDNMFGKLCDWTTTNWGQGLIAGTLIVVGASHFGWLSGIADTSLPVIGSVGNLMGVKDILILDVGIRSPDDVIQTQQFPFTDQFGRNGQEGIDGP